MKLVIPSTQVINVFGVLVENLSAQQYLIDNQVSSLIAIRDKILSAYYLIIAEKNLDV